MGRLTLALGLLLLSACKQPAAVPVKATPRVPASPPDAAEAAASPPRDPFALDEASDDPAAALESARHNCCDEMGAEELREHTAPARSK